MANNYDKQVLIARQLFLKYDQQELIQKLHLEHDDSYLYLTILNRTCRILRLEGKIELRSPCQNDSSLSGDTAPAQNTSIMSDAAVWEESQDYNLVMTIYDALCYPKETPVLAHQWAPLASLQVTMSSPSADLFTQKYADFFSDKTDHLLLACQKLGGRRPDTSAGADVCWEFDFFPGFPIQFRFWDKDEEFPPQIRLLWDKNSLRFMHFETLYYALHVLLEELKKAMPAHDTQNRNT